MKHELSNSVAFSGLNEENLNAIEERRVQYSITRDKRAEEENKKIAIRFAKKGKTILAGKTL